ncbi:MAG: CDP-alcohol phosphatidyltransferase family protein [Bacteroidales bacterium]|nr:CDP-alcohol phosphatidyltransferase family protein [Bacteroidales bacterium]
MNKIRKQSNPFQKFEEIVNSISRDRTRTNLLRKHEQRALAYLVQVIPSWMTSDMLTALGFIGSIIVSASFFLATYVNIYFLLLGPIGFTVSWFGDSLDGRVAYYRKKPRRMYGFALDITMDWLSIILIGCGYIVYVEGIWELLGYGFVVMYGWEMIIALMRYKVTGKYSIDSGKFGPTEVRIIISSVMIVEVFVPGSLMYSSVFVCAALFIINVMDTNKLLKLADDIDRSGQEKSPNKE